MFGFSLPSLSDWGLRALLAALNHLLDQDESARSRLQPHAGRIVRLGLSQLPGSSGWPAPLDVQIGSDGRLVATSSGLGEPSVSMTLRASPDVPFAFLQGGMVGLQRYLSIEGDVLLAASMGELARSLRWDVEEDLSKITGDVAAHRLVGWANGTAQAMVEVAQRMGSSFSRYFTVEQPDLVARGELLDHAAALSSLESRLSSLDRRVRKRG